VIQPSDDWNAPQPFLLERQDRAFGDRDGTMLADRAEALLDAPVLEQRALTAKARMAKATDAGNTSMPVPLLNAEAAPEGASALAADDTGAELGRQLPKALRQA